MELERQEQEIVEEFSMFDEWLDKYEYIIDMGKSLANFPEEKKTDDRLIKGCQSRVWLDSRVEDGKIFFTADSDAIITKGIIPLMIASIIYFIFDSSLFFITKFSPPIHSFKYIYILKPLSSVDFKLPEVNQFS